MTSPITTGGSPMQVLRRTISAPRPGNRPSATAAPSGRPIAAAIATAERLMPSDSRTIPNRTGSRPATKVKAAPRAAEKSVMRALSVQYYANKRLSEQIWNGCRNMQPSAGRDAPPELMSTAEVADYLQLGERTVYELVRTRRIPCSRVTGKWLFPRRLIDEWVAGGAEYRGDVPLAPPPVIAGSHDPL